MEVSGPLRDAAELETARTVLLAGGPLFPRQERAVTRLPLAGSAEALGIVIRSGAPKPKPVKFWAYLWAADEEAVEHHWHEKVPAEHAA
jgi:hypothetical protein